jgi:hypothetical protein
MIGASFLSCLFVLACVGRSCLSRRQFPIRLRRAFLQGVNRSKLILDRSLVADLTEALANRYWEKLNGGALRTAR